MAQDRLNCEMTLNFNKDEGKKVAVKIVAREFTSQHDEAMSLEEPSVFKKYTN